MHIQSLPQAGCRASAQAWRTHAEVLRGHAQVSYLTEIPRGVLTREAEAADRQADHWLDAAQEDQAMHLGAFFRRHPRVAPAVDILQDLLG